MPRRVPSPFNFFSLTAPVCIRTPSCSRLIRDDFPTPLGPATVVVFPEDTPGSLQYLLLCRADKQQRIATGAIAFSYFRDHFVGSQIRLVHTDQCRNSLFFHQNQKSIQQIKIGFRTHKGKNNKRLIHICYCRTDQAVCSRQDFIQISLFFSVSSRTLIETRSPGRGFSLSFRKMPLARHSYTP